MHNLHSEYLDKCEKVLLLLLETLSNNKFSSLINLLTLFPFLHVVIYM